MELDAEHTESVSPGLRLNLVPVEPAVLLDQLPGHGVSWKTKHRERRGVTGQFEGAVSVGAPLNSEHFGKQLSIQEVVGIKKRLYSLLRGRAMSRKWPKDLTFTHIPNYCSG